MLFGENPFNDPKNVVSEDISIIDLAAGCGCTVYIGGKLLTRPALQQQSQSADIDSLVDETHRLKLTNSNNIEFTNSILPIATPAAKQSQSHTSVIRLSIAAMDLMSRMLIRDPEKRATMRQVVRDLWLI
jgi:serine/threonine protein kinase